MPDQLSTPTTTSRVFHSPIMRIIVGAIVCTLASFGTSLLLKPVLASAGDWGRILRWTLSAAAVLAVYYLLFSRYEKRQVTELSRSGALTDSLVGVAIGTALVSLTVAILFLLGVYEVVAINGARALFFPLLMCVAAAAWEEVIFRGVLYRITETSLGTNLALIISAIPFGLLHLCNESANAISVLSATAGGVLMAMGFLLTRKLWLPIFFHAAWNWAQLAYGLTVSGIIELPGFVQSRMTGPDLLTGGAFGPENSLVAVGVVVLAAALAYLYAWRTGKISPRPRRT